jgi:hypothetical protein
MTSTMRLLVLSTSVVQPVLEQPAGAGESVDGQV